MNYKPLVTLSFRHTYYTDGVMRGVTLHPFAATAKKLANYRMQIKGGVSEFRVLQECRTGETPAISVDRPFDIAFGFHSNDPDFQARTDVEFYSSNRQKLVFDLREETEEAPTFRLLPVTFGNLHETFAQPASGTFTIKSSSAEVVAERVIQEETNVVFDLEECAEDVYRLELNGVLQKEFLLLHTDSAFEGVVFLRITGARSSKTISFSPRSIHWQYTVVPKYNTYGNLSLVDETESVLFEKAPHPDVPGAVCFVSLVPVRLGETYAFRLQVEDTGRVVKKKIPFADLKNIGRCLINVHNYCLQNYVTV